MNCADMTLNVSSSLEAVVADGTNVVTVLMNAPDVIVQVGTTFEFFATPRKFLVYLLIF